MYKVNISIDDVSPHPLSSTKVLDRCHELIEEFKDIKFTLFVPISYWRTMPPDPGRSDTRTSFALQINLYPEFCKELKSLPQRNFEVAYHGFFHGIPQQNNNDEFRNVNYSTARERFEFMFEVVKSAKLENIFKPIFRPPAWKMSADAIKAARDVGIKILALSPKPKCKETYGGENENFGNVVYYNVNPPFDPLTLCDKTEIVYHACEWDKNYLDKYKTDDLKSFLKQNEDKIDFCFMGDINGTV